MPPLKDRSRAAYQQQQELEAQLEACLAELRNLCLREAEFTGRLPQEYPLRQGDKVPPVRRRIGTAFRLDEKTIVSPGLDPLSILERDLALQLQIAAATRHLYREENLSKHIKKHRKNLVLKEERKLKELESAVNECRTVAAQEPRPSNTAPSEETQAPSHPAAQQLMVPDTPHSSLALPTCSAPPLQHTGLPLTQCEGPEQEHAPLQTSPWMETSLVRPETPKKHSAERCHMPSPAMPARAQRTAETSPYRFIPIETLTLWRQAGSSGPQIPERPARRRQSQSVRVDVSRDQVEPRGRSMLPRRCCTYYKVNVSIPTYSVPPSKPNLASNSIYHSSSKDSRSDISSITNAPSHGSRSPDIAFLRPVPLLSLKQPLPGCRSQHAAGPEAAYYYHPPQKGLLPPSCFPAVEYMSGREFCQGYPSLWAGSSAPAPYEQEKVQLYCQGWGPAQSKIMCTPSLKDHALGSGRPLSKLSVSEELKLWHERTKLRNVRPHSLERERAFHTRNML
ncbi:innate immunity activator protein isoform X2 [Pelodiscus sinensis]